MVDGLVVRADYLVVLEARLVHQEAVNCNISDLQATTRDGPIDMSSGLYRRMVSGLTMAMFILGLISCSIV
jgi:hypothetical protein